MAVLASSKWIKIRYTGDTTWNVFPTKYSVEMTHDYPETFFRLADGSLKVYNAVGGKHYTGLILTFDKLSESERTTLRTWINGAKGSGTVAPKGLDIQWTDASGALQTFTNLVVLDTKITEKKQLAPKYRLIGYSGQVTMTSVVAV